MSADTFELHIPRDSPYFEGHFPGMPVLPGIAQLAAVLEACRCARTESASLVAIPRLRLRATVRPGDKLVLRLTGDTTVRFELTRGGDRVADGALHFQS